MRHDHSGPHLTVLVSVDVATSWCGLQAVWGTTDDRVGAARWHSRAALPFPLRERPTDNGSEFLTDRLVRWCRKEGIPFTRGRPYKKHDHAWGEQKNWVAVGKLIGYDRSRTRAAHAQLGRVLVLIADYLNFCQPVRTLVHTTGEGARVRKQYHSAQIPFQRLFAADVLFLAHATRATVLATAINPVALRTRLDRALNSLWSLADHPVSLLPSYPAFCGATAASVPQGFEAQRPRRVMTLPAGWRHSGVVDHCSASGGAG